ncbi:unnamed protein product [Mytilus edulis]|uniref:Uncharacterized protein n=1 Tax=Mytilus edulis TaxID=6550 RepID=A0A8S3RJI4_MYTED|nr:unnamed protein product [Mytilus edulis]
MECHVLSTEKNVMLYKIVDELPIQKSMDIFNLDDDNLIEVLLGSFNDTVSDLNPIVWSRIVNDNSTTDSIDTVVNRLDYGAYGLANSEGRGPITVLKYNQNAKTTISILFKPEFRLHTLALRTPVDLLVDDTFVYIYAAAFGCTSFAVLELILDPEELKSVSSDILPWIRVPVWLLFAVVASFKFYPIFAAIRHSTPIIGPVVGFLHCGYLMSETLFELIQSKKDEDNENEQIEIKFIAYLILINVPILVCFTILISYFLYKGTMDTVNVIRGVPYKTKLNVIETVKGLTTCGLLDTSRIKPPVIKSKIAFETNSLLSNADLLFL